MRFSRLLYVFIWGSSFLLAPDARAYSLAKSTFEAHHESYISSGQAYFGGANTESEFSTAGMHLDYFSKKGKYDSKIDVHAFYSFTEDYPYVNPTQAFTNRHSDRFDTSYGRKLEEWSEADEFWETGLWQGRFNWNKTHPESVGLTGVFFKGTRRDSSKWLGFITPFYIPEQGPHFKTQDGQVVSKSPWFLSPPKEALIGPNLTPLTYTIDRPETMDVVLSPGAGFRVNNEITERDVVGFGYAYKPINQMVMSYDYRLRLLDATQEAPVTVVPSFPYHHIMTADWHRRVDRWKLLTSATYERPQRSTENSRLISQQIGDQTLATAIVSYDLAGEGASAFTMYGGVLKSWGAVKPDSGDTIAQQSQFEIRQRWLEAYRMGLHYPMWSKLKRLHNKLELTYDRTQNGTLFTSQVEYSPFNQWILTASFDMLAVYDSRQTRYDKAFIRQFRANDRVSMGFSYVY